MTQSVSRRQVIKSAALGLVGLSAATSSTNVNSRSDESIEGTVAPELRVPQWIDSEGKPRAPFSIVANRGKWIYLKCFQDWCPSCHSVGFPNLQRLLAAFPDNDNLVAAVVQTTFEGFSTNTFDALRKNQLRYNLSLPFGHDPGNDELPAEAKGRYPTTMLSYRTRGTPWVVLINPDGVVVFSDFHINIESLISYFKKELVT